MPNPFYYGGHVNPDQFVGRKGELRRIFAALDIASTGQLQSISVVGPRRIGKSSLLYYVANKYSNYLNQAVQYRVAYIDLQDADCKTLDGLMGTILDNLKVAKTRAKSPLQGFQDAILNLRKNNVYPVVCLDEFEALSQKPQEFTDDLYDSWRHLIGAHAIAFISASKTPPGELIKQEKLTSSFFNVFTILVLQELTDDEALELLDRGLMCDRPFSQGDRDRMHLLTGNHPYKIQLTGSLIYQSKEGNGETDWAWVQREFQQQTKQIGVDKPSTPLGNVSTKSLRVIPILGSTILEVFLKKKREEINESTAWIVGTTIIIILVVLFAGIIIGVIPFSFISQLVKSLVGLK